MKGGFEIAAQNPISVVHSRDSRSDPIRANPTEPLSDEERERIHEYYRSLSFKEFLAACPIDDIDSTGLRSREVQL